MHRTLLFMLLTVALLAAPASAYALVSGSLAGGELTVTLDDEPQALLSCGTLPADPNVLVNGNEVLAGGVPVSCATLTGLIVDGDEQPDVIDLRNMSTAAFPLLASVVVNGGDGDDTLTGSDFADALDGGPGNDLLDGDDNPLGTLDLVSGGEGDDTMVWNPGKDDDRNIGGPGNDTARIEGGGGGEEFSIAPSPDDPLVVRLARTTLNGAPAAFFVDISETELLQLNANGGNDTVVAGTLPAGLLALHLAGGDGDDILTGSDGADALDGGPGNDLLDGDDNPLGTLDLVSGGEGDDTMVWNPGKDDDRNIGGPGNDTTRIEGGGGGEEFSIAPSPDDPLVVRLARTTLNGAPAAFFVDISETELLQLNANGGNDTVVAGTLPAGLLALHLAGGDGDDILTGSDGADALDGGPGNDLLDGDDNPLGTLDLVSGGDGDDTMVWNPGKDDDRNIGGPGNDTARIEGGGGGEEFSIAPSPDDPLVVRLARTTLNGAPAAFFVDISETELLQLNANGGNDTVVAGTLPAGLLALHLDGGDGDDILTGSDGADALDGGSGNDLLDGDDNPLGTLDLVSGGDGDDTMVWNPGKDDDRNIGGPGNDTARIEGGGGGEEFSIAPSPDDPLVVRLARTTLNGAPAAFFVDISETELLQLNANGGNDTVIAGTLPDPVLAPILLEINGGDGDDTITGSVGGDVLRGDAGNDILTAGENPQSPLDQVNGGDGDDTLIWAPGDDSDVNEGGTGIDTVVVNAAGASETFDIALVGGRTHVLRSVPIGGEFLVDSGGIEAIELNTLGGDDRVNTQMLAGVEQILDGGAGNDALSVAGFAGNAFISPILKPGFAQIAHNSFASTSVVRSGGSFTAVLEGAQEVPPVDTPATGRGTVTLDVEETGIVVRMEFSQLLGTATVAHIHGPAEAGQVAAPLFDLGSVSGSAGAIELAFPVTPEQVLQLKSGLWYFNVHSSLFANGEIRGQILPDLEFEATIQARQVVPRSSSAARGAATATLAGSFDSVVFTVTYDGLLGEASLPGASTAVRVRGPAAIGQIGPIVDGLSLQVSGTPSDTFQAGPFDITREQAEQLRDGLWYIEVGSQEFPDGEIRGQFTRAIFFDAFE